VDPNDTYYSDHAKLFLENMRQLEIPHYVEHIVSQGSYRANCLYKPQFILKCMEKFKKPILWLDIDSYVHKKLDMFDNIDSDIIFATNSIDQNGKFLPKASPIFLNQTEKSYNFMNKWIEKCNYYLKNERKFFDHELMLEVLNEETVEVALFGKTFCSFADVNDPNAVITMGISSGTSKVRGLLDMGQNEQTVRGNSTKNTYYTQRGFIK
jgi:hypothetical protein